MIVSKKKLFIAIACLFSLLAISIFYNGLSLSSLKERVVVCGDLDARITYLLDKRE